MFPAAALLVGWIWSCWWDSAPNGVAAWAMRLPSIILGLGLLGLAARIWRGVGRLVPNNSTLLLPNTPEMRCREAFCVVGAEAYQRLREETGRPFRIVARQELDRSTLFLISNQR
jgi:hypothetical protein